MSRQDAGNGPRCPANPEHGHTYGARNPKDWNGYYCPHVEHAGLTRAHAGGPTPATSPFFAASEVGLD